MSAPDKPKTGKGGVSPRAKMVGILVIGMVAAVMFAMPYLRQQPGSGGVFAAKHRAQHGKWSPADSAQGEDSVNRPQVPNADGFQTQQKSAPPPPLSQAGVAPTGKDGDRQSIRALLANSEDGGLATEIGNQHGGVGAPPVPVTGGGSTPNWSTVPVQSSGGGQPPPPTPQQKFAQQLIQMRERAFLKAITSKIPLPVAKARHGQQAQQAPTAMLQRLEQERLAVQSQIESQSSQLRSLGSLVGTGKTAYYPEAGHAGPGGFFLHPVYRDMGDRAEVFL